MANGSPAFHWSVQACAYFSDAKLWSGRETCVHEWDKWLTGSVSSVAKHSLGEKGFKWRNGRVGWPVMEIHPGNLNFHKVFISIVYIVINGLHWGLFTRLHKVLWPDWSPAALLSPHLSHWYLSCFQLVPSILISLFYISFFVLFVLWSGELKNNFSFLRWRGLFSEHNNGKEKEAKKVKSAFPWVHAILSRTADGKWKRNQRRRTRQSPK